MEELWLCTIPNVEHVSPDATFIAIKQLVASGGNKSCEIYKVEIPPLHHGTLDSLIALSDDLGKVETQIDGVVKKIERQYFEMQALNTTRKAGAPIPPLKVQDRSVESYLQRWTWDFARYQHQGKKLSELVQQITVLTSTADEELKALLAAYAEKAQALANFQRKKVINLTSSDFEDFLTSAGMYMCMCICIYVCVGMCTRCIKHMDIFTNTHLLLS